MSSTVIRYVCRVGASRDALNRTTLMMILPRVQGNFLSQTDRHQNADGRTTSTERPLRRTGCRPRGLFRPSTRVGPAIRFTVGLPNVLSLSCKSPSRGNGSAARRLPHLTFTRLQAARRRTKSAAAGASARLQPRTNERRLVGSCEKLGGVIATANTDRATIM